MLTAIILIIIILYIIYCIKRYTKSLGKGCCGGGNNTIREKIIIDDKLYPIKETFKVEGMTCENCAAIIERRLNKSTFKGVVDFKNNNLTIHSKEEISFNEINEIVENAGYLLVK